MADFEDDNEFNSTQIQNLVGNVIATIFNADTVYDRLKVNQWTQQIIESVIKELAKLDKPMKYIVTCVIQQNNGAGMQSAATCTWDVRNDGLISIKTDINAINLFCTVYAITIWDWEFLKLKLAAQRFQNANNLVFKPRSLIINF